MAAEVGARLHEYVRRHDLGRVFGAETGYILARHPDTVRAPDASFLSHVRLGTGDLPDGYWPDSVLPGLAVAVDELLA